MFREDLSRNFGFILHDVSRLLRTTFDRRVKALGFTRSQWWVLTHLFRNDGVTQSELAEVLEIEKPTLGRLLDRLEAKGWVRRESDAADRRVKRLFLTEEVEPAIKAMRAAAAEMRRDALAGLSPEEQERFVDTLLSVKTNLTSYDSGVVRTGNGGARNGNVPARNGNGGSRNGNDASRNSKSGVVNHNPGAGTGSSPVRGTSPRNGNGETRKSNGGPRNASRPRGR